MGHDCLGLVIHFHGIVTASSLTLGDLFFLFKVIFALVLEVDASVLGHLFLTGRLSALNTTHRVIFPSGGSDGLAIGFTCSGNVLFFSFFGKLFSAVFLIVGLHIGFGLLRGELGGRRSFRIPTGC